MPQQGIPQRAAPKLVDVSLPVVQAALDQAFAYIFQLQSALAAVKATPNLVASVFGSTGVVIQEVLSAKATATIASPQAIPAAEGDVTGATITLDRTGTYKIDACVSMNGDNTTGQTIVKLNYNGANQTDNIIEALVTSASGSFNGTYAAHWVIQNTGTKIAKLRCIKALNAGTAQITGARITAVFTG